MKNIQLTAVEAALLAMVLLQELTIADGSCDKSPGGDKLFRQNFLNHPVIFTYHHGSFIFSADDRTIKFAAYSVDCCDYPNEITAPLIEKLKSV